jgi:hypothetical protein
MFREEETNQLAATGAVTFASASEVPFSGVELQATKPAKESPDKK